MDNHIYRHFFFTDPTPPQQGLPDPSSSGPSDFNSLITNSVFEIF